MWNNLRITQRFILVLSFFWLSGAAVIAVSYWGLYSARDSLKTTPWPWRCAPTTWPT